jgi:hypothetical protein
MLTLASSGLLVAALSHANPDSRGPSRRDTAYKIVYEFQSGTIISVFISISMSCNTKPPIAFSYQSETDTIMYLRLVSRILPKTHFPRFCDIGNFFIKVLVQTMNTSQSFFDVAKTLWHGHEDILLQSTLVAGIWAMGPLIR